MNASTPAHAYQKISQLQREHGKKLIHEELQPPPGDIVLDLGCGTEELSAYTAELVADKGKVLGVDPDSERIKPARALIGRKAMFYLSNRPQVSMVYRLINHAGCWLNTRRICKSRAAGE